MFRSPRVACLSFIALVVAWASLPPIAWAEAPYEQREDVVIGQVHGVALTADIFLPTGPSNGLALVDIASGAWHSDRGKIEDHRRAQMYDIFCGRGYTVFAVRPGSSTRFTALEMADNVKQAIRWARSRHEEFKIDPERIGLAGASAGGHLACLVSVTGDDGKSNSKDPVQRQGCRVQATVAFFPPTDFLNWDGREFDPKASGPVGMLASRLVFQGSLKEHTDEDLIEGLTKISPARLVQSQAPPFLFIHGDADPLVPLQQSEVMVEALKKAGIDAELIVKKGGAHPWPTIHEEVAIAADWFDKTLKAADKPTEEAEKPAPAEAETLEPAAK